MRLTEHFTVEELQKSEAATRHGVPNICPPELAGNMLIVADHLELIREHYGVPVRVLSCYRSPEVNKLVGGSETSAHRFALAADFEVDGVSNHDVATWCAENISDYDQIINEFPPDGWVHIGFTGKTPRKQLLTAVKTNGKTVYNQGIA